MMKIRLCFIFVLSTLFCVSCGFIRDRLTGEDKKQTIGRIGVYVPEDEAPAESSGGSPPSIPVSIARTLSGKQALLEQGNMWTAGIPGFGENALPAITGEYLINDGGSFRVWLCRELLYYDGWEPMPDIQAFRVLRKNSRGGFLAAAAFNEVWTGVFLFNDPEGQLRADTGGAELLSPEDIDRIMTVFRNRFLYFSSLSRASDISLPASINF
jgi:hypothetical protein